MASLLCSRDCGSEFLVVLIKKNDIVHVHGRVRVCIRDRVRVHFCYYVYWCHMLDKPLICATCTAPPRVFSISCCCEICFTVWNLLIFKIFRDEVAEKRLKRKSSWSLKKKKKYIYILPSSPSLELVSTRVSFRWTITESAPILWFLLQIHFFPCSAPTKESGAASRCHGTRRRGREEAGLLQERQLGGPPHATGPAPLRPDHCKS
jgi:hypothetical protein